MRRLPFALLAGALLWLAFPGHDLWWLAPIGVAVLAVATAGAGPWRAAALGLVTGLVFFGATLQWSGSYLGYLPWFGLSALEALYAAGLCLLTGWLQRDGRIRPLAVALAWVAQEAARSRTPYGGFPWVRLAFSQADAPTARLAALGGAPLVTFAVALAGGLLAAAGVAGVAGVAAYRRGWRRTLLSLGGAFAVVAVGLAVPLATGSPQGPQARVLAVQGNVPRPGLDFNAERRQVLDNHVTTTLTALSRATAAGAPPPDLVLWPENASDIDPVRNADAAAEIQRTTDAAGAPLVLGGLIEVPPRNVANVSLLYLPGEGLSGVYVKQHPVPFAEWIPDRSFFRLISTQVDLVQRDIVAGPAPVIFHVQARTGTPIAVGPSICFEVAYDDLVRANVEQGATLLVVQTNNATFGFTDESVQQLAISRLRAIEHGRAVVHVSTVGVSALVLPDGSTVQRTGLFEAAALQAQLPLLDRLTLADVLGSWPEYAALLALGGIVLVSATARVRKGRPTS